MFADFEVMSLLFVNFYKTFFFNISGRGRGYGYSSYGKLKVFFFSNVFEC